MRCCCASGVGAGSQVSVRPASRSLAAPRRRLQPAESTPSLTTARLLPATTHHDPLSPSCIRVPACSISPRASSHTVLALPARRRSFRRRSLRRIAAKRGVVLPGIAQPQTSAASNHVPARWRLLELHQRPSHHHERSHHNLSRQASAPSPNCTTNEIDTVSNGSVSSAGLSPNAPAPSPGKSSVRARQASQ